MLIILHNAFQKRISASETWKGQIVLISSLTSQLIGKQIFTKFTIVSTAIYRGGSQSWKPGLTFFPQHLIRSFKQRKIEKSYFEHPYLYLNFTINILLRVFYHVLPVVDRMLASLQKFTSWSSNLQYDGIWKWCLWKVIRLDHKSEISMMELVALKE